MCPPKKFEAVFIFFWAATSLRLETEQKYEMESIETAAAAAAAAAAEAGEGRRPGSGKRRQTNQSIKGRGTNPPPPVPSFPPKGETSRFDSFWPPASFCVGGDPAGHGVFLYFIVFLLGTWKLSRLLLEICKKSAKRKALLLWQMTEVRWVGDAVRYERLETPRLFSRKKIGDR